MHLRIARLSDAEGVAALEHELFPWNNLSPEGIGDELLYRTCWVAVDSAEGKIRGYVLAKVSKSFTDIIRLGVSQMFQGNRVGCLLLGAVLHTEETFLTVDKLNVRAVRFYLNNGFHADGECLEGKNWLMRRTA
jgi:ribosomal protein S18 acetylase RimI-like enzyme